MIQLPSGPEQFDALAFIRKFIPLVARPYRSGGKSGSGQWITATFASPNVDTPFTLSLGHIPDRYIVVQKQAACDVYNGSNQGTDWTPNKIVLRATVATTVRIWVS